MKQVFVVYDERAIDDGTDDATVMVAAFSLKEVLRSRNDFPGCPIFSYDDVNGELLNEQYVGTLNRPKEKL